MELLLLLLMEHHPFYCVETPSHAPDTVVCLKKLNKTRNKKIDFFMNIIFVPAKFICQYLATIPQLLLPLHVLSDSLECKLVK